MGKAVANAFSEMVTRLGQIPEWPNGADCKSAVFRLRWFESIFAHNVLKKRMQTSLGSYRVGSVFVCLQILYVKNLIAEVAQSIEH